MSYDPRAPKPISSHIERPRDSDAASIRTKTGTEANLEKVPAAGASSLGGDLGQAWLDSYTGNRPDLTDESSSALVRRIDLWLMPVLFLIYFCQQLDKSSVSFAAVFGFQTDANLQGSEYSWLSSIVYFAQLVFQPLSVYALVKFPVHRWILFCLLGWGASCMILAAFKSFAGLLVFRFVLGAFEASISPSMLIIVSMWWTRREQPMRNNIWYSANGIALILGSLLAYGLASWSTALHTYQLIFLFAGAIALLVAVPTFFILPAHPTTTRWLSSEQKYLALERIRLNNTGTANTTFKWAQVRECFLDLKIWGFILMVFCISFVSGGIGAFGPLIISGFGYGPFQTILYNMIPGAIGIVSNIIAAYCVQTTKRKAPILLGILVFPISGAAALYALPRGDQYNRQLLAVYFILQIFQPITPVIFSWCFANTAGHTKKSAVTGALYIGLCVGNIVGPQLYLSSEKPYYKTGLTANLIVLIILFGLIILQTLYLTYLNKRNNKRRAAAGLHGKNVDYSLENSKNWAAIRAKEVERNLADGGKEEVYNSKAFDDLTDKQNYNFVYSL